MEKLHVTMIKREGVECWAVVWEGSWAVLAMAMSKAGAEQIKAKFELK